MLYSFNSNGPKFSGLSDPRHEGRRDLEGAAEEVAEVVPGPGEEAQRLLGQFKQGALSAIVSFIFPKRFRDSSGFKLN